MLADTSKKIKYDSKSLLVNNDSKTRKMKTTNFDTS